jgi:hypothetical protein
MVQSASEASPRLAWSLARTTDGSAPEKDADPRHAAARCQAEESFSVRLTSEARVYEHTPALEQRGLGPPCAFGVGPLVPLPGVDTLLKGGRRGVPFGESGQILADHVRPDHGEARTLGQVAGQGRFPRAGEAAHEDEARPSTRSLQLAQGQEPARAGLAERGRAIGLGDLAVRVNDPLDLPPHGGAVGGVERQQGSPLRVARGQEVRIGEGPREVPAIVTREVHHEERHVGHRVGVAEAVVELDAIHDDQIVRRATLREGVDVAETQVSVAVARDATGRACLDHRPEPREGVFGQRTEPVENGRAEGLADMPGGLLEVLPRIPRNLLEPRGRRNLRTGRGPGVERGDPRGEFSNLRVADHTTSEPVPERGLLGQADHLDGPLHRLARCVHADGRSLADHGDHAEVDRGCQAAVQGDFTLAELATLRERAVIEEPQRDRLLDLVRERSGEEDDGDMRLMDLHRVDRMEIRGRPG